MNRTFQDFNHTTWETSCATEQLSLTQTLTWSESEICSGSAGSPLWSAQATEPETACVLPRGTWTHTPGCRARLLSEPHTPTGHSSQHGKDLYYLKKRKEKKNKPQKTIKIFLHNIAVKRTEMWIKIDADFAVKQMKIKMHTHRSAIRL